MRLTENQFDKGMIDSTMKIPTIRFVFNVVNIQNQRLKRKKIITVFLEFAIVYEPPLQYFTTCLEKLCRWVNLKHNTHFKV
jgi:hypothetical protein